jgi:hypothetical protein
MIRIEIFRLDNGVTSSTLKHFEDHGLAANWLINDSYFLNHNVVKVVWEKLGCQHSWKFVDLTERDLQGFRCRHCDVEFSMVDGLIDEMFRKSQ